MSIQSDPLKTTPAPLQRFWFYCPNEATWYKIMAECRAWFGKNWQTQNKVRRKFQEAPYRHGVVSLPVWFDVSDPRFATWCTVKFGIQVKSDEKVKQEK